MNAAKIVAPASFPLQPLGNARISRREWLGLALLVGAVLWVYWPARNGGFVLDDDLLLTHNSIIQSSNGLFRFWWPWNLAVADKPADYWPVSNSTLWLEWRLWGMNPTGYHVTNWILHIADCLLIWLVLRRLSIPGAWLAALLFAVHPVNVESVAWIAQRKNMLALFFFLLSILWWLKGEENREARSEGRGTSKKYPRKNQRTFGFWYGLSLLAFLLAMLSKGSVAMLPLVLLLMVWWQRERITKADVLCCTPFFLVAVALTVVNMRFESQGASEVIRNVTLLQRLLGAGAVVWFYLGKALVPLHLVFVYPQWNIQPGDLRWWLPLLAAFVVSAVFAWLCRRSSATSGRGLIQAIVARPVLFAWTFFCISLLPVMGFTDVGYMQHSLVADHYQHIALIGVVASVAAAATYGWNHFQRLAHSATVITAGAIVVAFTILARLQSGLYAGPLTLYQDTVENNPNSWLAHNNLGDALAQANRSQEAIVQFEQTLQLKPDSAMAHNNLAMRLADVGRLTEAIDHYQQALRLQPQYPDAENNYAMALASAGRSQEALAHFQLALKCQPDFAEAYNNLGSLLLNMGRLEQAVDEFQLALKLKPDYLEAHNNLAIVLAKAGLFSQAIDQYQQALRIKPDSAETHNNLGNALTKAGRLPEAIEHYKQALQLKPDYVQAYIDLAMAQSAAGYTAQAISAAESALGLARLHDQPVLAAQIDAWLTAHRSGPTRR